jgi:N-methylhydantoinase B/oxoprolinase/acetone carboxylase alpha subunit
MPKKSGYKLDKGDKIIFLTGGGGGSGNPKFRKIEKIENDLKQEYLSKKYVEENFKHFKFN